MVKKRKKRVARATAKELTPPCDPESSHDDRSGFVTARLVHCTGCSVRQETIEFLRDQLRQRDAQVDRLEQKLLALVGDASDRYAKMRMMELTSEKPEMMRGVVPYPDGRFGMQDVESDPVDDLFAQLDKMPRTAVPGAKK